MNNPDLSTRLKLMGVDVASFGDYFADARAPKESRLPPIDSNGEVMINDKPSKRALAADGLVKCLTYHDPFSATYKKYIFTNDGTRILGGMMIGDVGSFTKLVAMTKSKVRPDVSSRVVNDADLTEKIDGTSIRVHLGSQEVRGG